MTEAPEGIGRSSGDPPTFWKGKTSELPQAFSSHPLGEMDVQEVNAKGATERTGKSSRREKRGH